MALTKKQQDVYDFLKKKILEDGYPPSVREICRGLNFKSTSTAHSYLLKLEKHGYIKRDPTKNRAISLTEDLASSMQNNLSIPLLGRVQAGQPILAVENIEDYFPVSPQFVGSGKHFFLEVSGESMKNAGIFDGDYVLVKQTQDANNGEMVVALLGEETTVKTLYKEKDHIRLQPENDSFEPILTSECEILGIVKAVMRFLR
ncbi:MAG TPA: transcriptional repressor LexA [Clostridia bacterium]|nr:transcriptional repressor LexA [Clostridia bacterium]